MEIYKKMYCTLFNRITDILETNVDDFTRKNLMKAQQETEEMFMSYCPIIEMKTNETKDL